ncbi:MAG: DNA translocase FtsK [Lachnospiraceae bacterium]|nr:DNA translocase FtsK [Lachnospiraceae bacterium]
MAAKGSRSSGKRSTNQRKAQGKKKNGLYDEVLVLVALAVSVLLLLSSFKLLGEIGNAIGGVMFGIFGLCAYIVPFVLYFSFVFYLSNRGNPVVAMRIYSVIFALIMVCALIHMFTLKDTALKTTEYYAFCSDERKGGGLFGAAIAVFLSNTIGDIGTYIVLFAVLAILLVIITEKSLIGGLKRGSRSLYERGVNKAKIHREYRETLEEEFEKERELRSREREERDRERLERIREREEERTERKKERNIKREERVRVKEEELAQRAAASEERKKRRSEMKVRGVMLDTKLVDDRERNDDLHEIKYDLTEEDYRALSLKNDHHISVEGTVDDDFIEKNDDVSFDVNPPIPLFDDFDDGDDDLVIKGDLKKDEEADEMILPPPVRKKSTGQNADTVSQKAVEKRPAAEKPARIKPGKHSDAYEIPPVKLLDKPRASSGGDTMASLRNTAGRLKETLSTFGVNVSMTEISQGPTVTRFEMVPETGVKVSKILSLSDDIKLNMAAMDVRIEAPIPGKSAIGIEIPNKEPVPVHFRELMEDSNFTDASSKITFAVGKDIEGKVVVCDIAKMPHLLIAGATGSGKSVCINTLIMSILYKARPDEVKLIMIDPKVVELSVYNGIPHLMIPVVTDPRKASAALQWGVAEMTDRYNKFAEFGVRDMKGYNRKVENDFKDVPPEERPEKMPQIVIIVDELADLMMVASKEVEASICRIAQLARAAGIHLVIATQRPSVDVITGLIKANMPSRIAFSVTSGVDSRTILDMTGAEKLLGKGDMLFYPQGYTKPARLQGAFVTDDEVASVVQFIKDQGEAEYDGNVLSSLESGQGDVTNGAGASSGIDEDGRDELFEKAARFIIEKDKASIGMLQRMFKIGFNRAARIMDQLAEAGVVGEEQGTKPREILMSNEQFDRYVEEYL